MHSLALLLPPQGLERSTHWRTCYKVARSKQVINASSSLPKTVTCSNTAIAELTTNSNTPPTDSNQPPGHHAAYTLCLPPPQPECASIKHHHLFPTLFSGSSRLREFSSQPELALYLPECLDY